MLKRTLSLAILCAAAPLAAWADQPAASTFGYTYAEGGYLSENPSGGGSDLTGVFVDGSYELQPHWRLTGEFSNASCCGSTDNRYGVGAGYYTDINSQFSFFADLSFLGQHVTNNGSHNGWGIDGGLRFVPVEKLELDGMVQHTDVNSTTENTIGVKALYSLTNEWRLFAGYSNNSVENDFQIGVRYVF